MREEGRRGRARGSDGLRGRRDVSVSRAEKGLVEHVRARADAVSPTARQVAEGWAYASIYHLLLDVGQLFTPAPLPASLTRRYPGFCFSNAAAACEEHPGRELVYVEGFGSTPVDGHKPVRAPHGWATTPAGEAVGPDLALPGRPRLPWHPFQ